MKRISMPLILSHGYELALASALALISLVFTVWPEALSHEPVGFETLGPIHHIWHYSLLAGALLTLGGLVASSARAEMMGLILLVGAISINLIALITDGGSPSSEGIAIAFRTAALLGVFSRLYLIAFFLPSVAKQQAH